MCIYLNKPRNVKKATKHLEVHVKQMSGWQKYEVTFMPKTHDIYVRKKSKLSMTSKRHQTKRRNESIDAEQVEKIIAK
jgi:hypothetical protein